MIAETGDRLLCQLIWMADISLVIGIINCIKASQSSITVGYQMLVLRSFVVVSTKP